MTCDEVELLLPDISDEPIAQAHLEECASCRESAAVLAMAAQPVPSATEKAKLVGLPSAVQREWIRLQRRHSLTRRFAGLAIAASVGATVASGVMWKWNSAPPPQVVQARGEPEVLVLMEDSSPLTAEDESSFEVSWPSLTDDGDVL